MITIMKKNYVKPTIDCIDVIMSESLLAGSNEVFDTTQSPNISDIESDSKMNNYNIWNFED